MGELTKMDSATLADAAARAADSATRRTAGETPTPPAVAGSSPIDAAALSVAALMKTLLSAADTADKVAAGDLATALSTSPPEIVRQDQVWASSFHATEAPTAAAAAAAPGAPGVQFA